MRTVRFDELPPRSRRALFAALMTVGVGAKWDQRVLAFEVRTLIRGLWKVGLVLGAIGTLLTAREVVTRIIKYKIGSDPLTFMIMALAVAVLVASLIQFFVNQKWPKAPWALGDYLFAGHVVRADDGWLDITDTVPLGKPTLVMVKRNNQYSYSRVDLDDAKTRSFSYGTHERAEKACDAYVEARIRYATALEAKDLAAAEAEDPLAECALTGTWTGGGAATDVPSVAARPRSVKARLIASAVIGVLVGGVGYVLVDVLRIGQGE
ncbi:MAG: hypothetical protein JNM17_18670 [Archangium sp.]|nr:hypothetical protein [Archangium sp.]